jgi:maltose-binding protein MalE
METIRTIVVSLAIFGVVTVLCLSATKSCTQQQDNMQQARMGCINRGGSWIPSHDAASDGLCINPR